MDNNKEITQVNQKIIEKFSLEELEERLETTILFTNDSGTEGCSGGSCYGYLCVNWTTPL